jgi:hypothetical protein
MLVDGIRWRSWRQWREMGQRSPLDNGFLRLGIGRECGIDCERRSWIEFECRKAGVCRIMGIQSSPGSDRG